MPAEVPRFFRAFLLHPPTGPYVREDRCQSYMEGTVTSSLRPPMEIAYVASMLEREGVTCRIRDYAVEGGDMERMSADLASFNPDLLVVSCISPELDRDLSVCAFAKRTLPGLVTVARGAHFLADDEAPLRRHPYVDFAVRGEPELTVSELARGEAPESVQGLSFLESGAFKRTPERPFIQDLDSLPFPARHLIRNELYVRADTGAPQATIQTSRGCPSRCIFCLTQAVSGNRIRYRSPDNIMDEIRVCKDRFGIHDFFFRADTFTADKEWTLHVCQALCEQDLRVRWVCNSRVDTLDDDRLRWMKKAGCWGISLGVESGSAEMIRQMKKGISLDQAWRAVRMCRSHGILSFAYFLIGLPWETRTTLRRTFRFSRALDPDLVEYYFVYPFPGTELHQIVTEQGLLKGLPDKCQSSPAFEPPGIDRRTMERMRKRAVLRFHLRPRFLVRTVMRIRSVSDVMSIVRLGWRVIRRNFKTKEGFV